MGTIIIILILAAIVVGAILSIRKRIKYGSSCCGTHDAAPAKVKVKDKKIEHYPYSYKLTVDGMHCSNCSRRVENALNSKEGLWATVKLEDKSVLVRAKNPMTEEELSRPVSEAGYTVLDFSTVE